MSGIDKRKIDYRFKILYAVGIIMVCCGHTDGGGISLLNDWFPFGGFHLAIFVFASGYFYNSYEEDDVCRYVLKKIRTLILPLYIYNLAYGLVVQLLRTRGFDIGGNLSITNLIISPIIDGHQFAFNMGGWFVVPLFVVEILNAIFRRIIKVILKRNLPEWSLFVISIVIGIVGNTLAIEGYLSGVWVLLIRVMYFIPFYGLGIYYKRVFEQYDRRIPSFWYFAIIFVIKMFITCYYGRVIWYTVSWCNNFTEGPIMPIVIGVLGIALWMRIALILEPVIGQSKWINLIADNTYSIMINQFMGFMIIKSIYAVLNYTLGWFAEFDWYRYRNDIWYYYRPRNMECTLIIYVVGGIAFSIIIQKIVNMCKRSIKV